MLVGMQAMLEERRTSVCVRLEVHESASTEVVQFLDQFVKMEVTPLVGLQLTIIGLVLLLVGGIGRLVVALLDRSKA